MTAPTRLGDLLRVVHELQPDADELRMIGELLPEHRRPEAAEASRPDRPRAAEAQAGPAPARLLRPTDPTRRIGRWDGLGWGRLSRPDWPWFWPGEPGPRAAAWWGAVSLLVLLTTVLWTTGALSGGAWLVTVAVAVAARPAWRSAIHTWAAWWLSAQRRSSVTYDDPGHRGGPDEPDAPALALDSARWEQPPPGQPLMDGSQQRAVATLLAGCRVPGEIDLVATVRELASRRPLVTFPRRPRWSTSLGMHLHVDTGPALEPFRDDIDHLREALIEVVSTYAVVELGFDGDPCVMTGPRRIVGDAGRLELADRPPLPGTPVLVVTDLGVAVPRTGFPPTPANFLAHHRLLTQAGCTVHYLVPYPAERWPPRLRGLPIVHWSDDLGVGEVLADIRRRVRA